MLPKGHKYIHFVDFSNPNVSLCDPYCVGLLRQHHSYKRPYFYDGSNLTNFYKYKRHPSVLNRFFLNSQKNDLGNFTMSNGKIHFQPQSFDETYIRHFTAETHHERFKELSIKGNEMNKNCYLPMDTYVPVEYFTNKDLFLKNYNMLLNLRVANVDEAQMKLYIKDFHYDRQKKYYYFYTGMMIIFGGLKSQEDAIYWLILRIWVIGFIFKLGPC